MAHWRIVLSDGGGDGAVDTLAPEVTVVASSDEGATTTVSVAGQLSASARDEGSSAGVVAGISLAGIGAAVALAWWVKAVKPR